MSTDCLQTLIRGRSPQAPWCLAGVFPVLVLPHKLYLC